MPGERLHLVAETIQLAKRGVNVGRDTDALEFLMNDGRGEDVMFVEQILNNGVGVCPFDVNVRDGARLIRIERRVEPNLGHIFETVHPVT